MFFGFEAENIEDFALASQICQAEALKSIVESFRTDPARTGVMVWNLSDGWPLFGEGCIDYYGCRKLAYYYLRRSQQDLMITLSEVVNWRRGVVIVNDSQQLQDGMCRIISAESGEIKAEFSFSAAAGSVVSLPGFEDWVSNRDVYLIQWTTAEGVKGCNHFLAGMPVYDFGVYSQKYLPQIAALDGSFEEGKVAL
jgi:beta-mannosidase